MMPGTGRRWRRRLATLMLRLTEARAPAGRFGRWRELEQSQWWSSEQLERLVETRLAALLRHAADTVEFYAEQFCAAGINVAAVRRVEDLGGLPILERRQVREHFAALTSRAVPEADRRLNATGGSTGEPLRLWQDAQRDDLNMADRYRTRRWAGWDFGEPSLTLWGAPTDFVGRRGLKTWMKGLVLGSERTLSAWDLGDDRLLEYARILERHRPVLVSGYVSALYLFARFLSRRGIIVRGVRGVISGAEVLFPHQREIIESVFRAPLLNRYATREAGGIAHECDHRAGMHVNIENILIEVVEAGRPCAVGTVGDLLVTTLNNRAMPLIRYRIGDRGMLLGRACPCGRGLPLMQVAEGRISDHLQAPSGRRVVGTLFPHLFKDYGAILLGQAVQERPDRVRVDLVLEAGANIEQLAGLQADLERVLAPDFSVKLRQVPDLVSTSTGKHRFVIPYEGSEGATP